MNRYIKSLRAFNDLSQTDVAKKLNISLQSYNRKEKGKVPFTVEEVKILSIYFKVPIENFFKHEVVNMKTHKLL